MSDNVAPCCLQVAVLADFDRHHTLDALAYTALSLLAAQLLGLVIYGPFVL
jgi:hypothetical protein